MDYRKIFGAFEPNSLHIHIFIIHNKTEKVNHWLGGMERGIGVYFAIFFCNYAKIPQKPFK